MITPADERIFHALNTLSEARRLLASLPVAGTVGPVENLNLLKTIGQKIEDAQDMLENGY
jgi:hypothetical protein